RPPRRVGEQTGRTASCEGAIRGRSGSRDGPTRRRRGRPAKHTEEEPHRWRPGHRAEDPAQAAAAVVEPDLEREYAAEREGPRQPSQPPRAPGRMLPTGGEPPFALSNS